MKYETNILDFTLEDASINDAEKILELIYEIADYEKLTDQVIATKESLIESIFVKKRAFVILAKFKDEVIGYMLYFYNFSTFTGGSNLYLEDLYLKPQYRHNGYGKMMFKILAQIAIKEKANRIDWVCLDWNKPSLKFYQSIGAKPLNNWVVHRLEGNDIINLANRD